MSISENKKGKKEVVTYLCITIFCLVFFLIYDQFSHGVRSRYMTYLFALPLVLGLFPAVILFVFQEIPRRSQMSANLYHSGVAAMTVSSLLRGIFVIAGTGSVYQEYLMITGIILLLAGLILYITGLVSYMRH